MTSHLAGSMKGDGSSRRGPSIDLSRSLRSRSPSLLVQRSGESSTQEVVDQSSGASGLREGKEAQGFWESRRGSMEVPLGS